MANNQILDMTGIAALRNLTSLNLANNNISLIQGIEHLFICVENLYSTPSRNPLGGASSRTAAIKVGFEQLVEQGHVTLWYKPNL